jgi:hypothetical protein
MSKIIGDYFSRSYASAVLKLWSHIVAEVISSNGEAIRRTFNLAAGRLKVSRRQASSMASGHNNVACMLSQKNARVNAFFSTEFRAAVGMKVHARKSDVLTLNMNAGLT